MLKPYTKHVEYRYDDYKCHVHLLKDSDPQHVFKTECHKIKVRQHYLEKNSKPSFDIVLDRNHSILNLFREPVLFCPGFSWRLKFSSCTISENIASNFCLCWSVRSFHLLKACPVYVEVCVAKAITLPSLWTISSWCCTGQFIGTDCVIISQNYSKFLL